MAFDKIHNKGQAQLFLNPKLEQLTKSNPLLIWGIYTPVIVSLPLFSTASLGYSMRNTFWIFLSGMLFWTLVEYFLHRYVFHYKPENEKGKKISYLFHGNHHHYPRDKERLFMPPIPSIVISSMFFVVYYLFLGNAALSFFAGFMLGYLLYGSIHYAIHAFNPPFKWMKPLWRNHHLHHYKDEEKGFGVTTTLWDRLFGTMFDLNKEKEDKEKVKELMY